MSTHLAPTEALSLGSRCDEGKTGKDCQFRAHRFRSSSIGFGQCMHRYTVDPRESGTTRALAFRSDTASLSPSEPLWLSCGCTFRGAVKIDLVGPRGQPEPLVIKRAPLKSSAPHAAPSSASRPRVWSRHQTEAVRLSHCGGGDS